MTIKRALVSVSDKTGVIELAQGLRQLGIDIIATGGTARLLLEQGITVTEVSDYTGFPEMLDGRVKTLHPKIHAGILARRNLPAHLRAMSEAAITTIDLVVVNLYPFAQTIGEPDCSIEDAIENIDIGGPTLIRAAAKNYQHVTIVTDHHDYELILAEIKANNGSTKSQQRFRLAQKAFSHTAAYDGAISNYITSIDVNQKQNLFPAQLNVSYNLAQTLRYGENPHQQAAFYRDLAPAPGGVVNYCQLQGKELSFNNIADTDTAWECVKAFDKPACVIVKHANPCGVAIADSSLIAFKLALATDPTSAFGGIIAFNHEVDETTAKEIVKQFIEVIVAPVITLDAQQVLAQKKNIRVLKLPLQPGSNQFDFKRVGGGILLQTPDNQNISANELKVVTKVAPTSQQLLDFLFAWRVARFVKSNAIVFCQNERTLGVGAGQMSRIDSARIAAIKAQHAELSLENSVVASDAFFPFKDGLDVVVAAGAKAVIQPGGSIRDDEVIAAANEYGIAMVFTGIRHFRH